MWWLIVGLLLGLCIGILVGALIARIEQRNSAGSSATPTQPPAKHALGCPCPTCWNFGPTWSNIPQGGAAQAAFNAYHHRKDTP